MSVKDFDSALEDHAKARSLEILQKIEKQEQIRLIILVELRQLIAEAKRVQALVDLVENGVYEHQYDMSADYSFEDLYMSDDMLDEDDIVDECSSVEDLVDLLRMKDEETLLSIALAGLKEQTVESNDCSVYHPRKKVKLRLVS